MTTEAVDKILAAALSANGAGPPPTQSHPALVFEEFADVAARVDAAGQAKYLLQPIFPADAYGVLAAEDKSGKSWAAGDAAVSVASGTPWLTAYPCDSPGPVLMLVGEGGERNTVRRLRAVARARGLDADKLPIRTLHRVPHLSNQQHLDQLAAELGAHPRQLVILDPLYLAARGASGSDLYAMGEALEGLQHICQQAAAALIVVTHFNKTGEGRGAKRITGVGPGAWGRVLITAHVEHRDTDADGVTTVILGLEMVGGEIPDTTLHIRRRVWADDPDNLSSPLNYALDVVDEVPTMTDARVDGLKPAAVRVLAVLTAVPLTVRDIGDRLADQGRPLRARTIQESCNALLDRGLADSLAAGAHGALAWILTVQTP